MDHRGNFSKIILLQLHTGSVLRQLTKKKLHRPVEDTASRRRYRMFLRMRKVIWICQLPPLGVIRPLAQVTAAYRHFHRPPRLTEVMQGRRVLNAPGSSPWRRSREVCHEGQSVTGQKSGGQAYLAGTLVFRTRTFHCISNWNRLLILISFFTSKLLCKLVD